MLTVLAVFSVIVSALTLMFVFVGKRMLQWMGLAIQYQRELLETRRKLSSVELALAIERAKKSLVTVAPKKSASRILDDKTKALIRLAVSNPEKLEGESAAMIVCKRLKEEIDD